MAAKLKEVDSGRVALGTDAVVLSWLSIQVLAEQKPASQVKQPQTGISSGLAQLKHQIAFVAWVGINAEARGFLVAEPNGIALAKGNGLSMTAATD